MKINYVKKNELFPALGYYHKKTNQIFIRKDLPKYVKRFVLEHEKQHYKGIKNEYKATLNAFLNCPISYIITLMYNTISLYRIVFKIKQHLGFKFKNNIIKLNEEL